MAGAASVAAPVLDHDARPIAVIPVSGPVERSKAEMTACTALLLDATGRLSVRMGHMA